MNFSRNIYVTFRVLFWGWLLTISLLMIIPTSGVSLNYFSGQDKLIHFGVFGLLGFLYSGINFKLPQLIDISFKNKSLYFLLLFSLLTEFAQLLLTYRTFEFLDLIMNSSGLLTGVFVGNAILRRAFQD